jgi:hypothetical protein
MGTLDKKLLAGGIFCDLAKAFDCVNHDTLLLKLNCMESLVKLIIGLNHNLWIDIKGWNYYEL